MCASHGPWSSNRRVRRSQTQPMRHRPPHLFALFVLLARVGARDSEFGHEPHADEHPDAVESTHGAQGLDGQQHPLTKELAQEEENAEMIEEMEEDSH